MQNDLTSAGASSYPRVFPVYLSLLLLCSYTKGLPLSEESDDGDKLQLAEYPDYPDDATIFDDGYEAAYDAPIKRGWNSNFSGGLGKRAWNSNFSGGMGKRAWNKNFAGGIGKRGWASNFSGGMGKRAWTSNFSGGIGKRGWNSNFAGGID